MSTITFQIIKRRGQKSGKCSVCGKRTSRAITFEQSINPWNKNANGDTKSISQIHDELVAKINAWKLEPVIHAGCEP